MPSRLHVPADMKLRHSIAQSLALPVLPPEKEWRSCFVKSLADAEELLDKLEACQFEERDFIIHGNATFEVRWR